MENKLLKGDNIELLKSLEDNSVDSIVTDPPYGLSFMNKKWDYDVPSVEFWKEVYRVLKPGGHILSFGGTRTYHRMVVNIEDAGFQIRDQIMWLYGSGFPKSHNIGKAYDKKMGNEREVIGTLADRDRRYATPRKGSDNPNLNYGSIVSSDSDDIPPLTKGNSPYEGWGTALKPANEPIALARKPFKGTVVDNVLKWGTGGINIDGCRVGETGARNNGSSKGTIDSNSIGYYKPTEPIDYNMGRFPANIILECICDEVIKGEKGEVIINNNGSGRTGDNDIYGKYKEIVRTNFTDKGDIHTNPNCPCYIMDEQSGISNPKKGRIGKTFGGNVMSEDVEGKWPADNGGGASRFFYQAKVSKKERNMGLDGFEDKENKGSIGLRTVGGTPLYEKGSSEMINKRVTKNNHPTVKPVSLMAYLVRLITPPNGIVLDPFMGSGSTGIASNLEGFNFIGMEMDEEYFKIAETRINSYEVYREFIK